MNLNPIVLALEPVLDALEALGISFHVTGSIASSAYGSACQHRNQHSIGKERPH